MNTEQNKHKDNTTLAKQLEYLQKINNLVEEYYFSLDLNNIPTFIINTAANLLADIMKIFISNNKHEHISLSNMIAKV